MLQTHEVPVICERRGGRRGSIPPSHTPSESGAEQGEFSIKVTLV